ncbi:MAG: hypothetical protein ACYDBQ_00075 [Thermoplasmatota archaeon]
MRARPAAALLASVLVLVLSAPSFMAHPVDTSKMSPSALAKYRADAGPYKPPVELMVHFGEGSGPATPAEVAQLGAPSTVQYVRPYESTVFVTVTTRAQWDALLALPTLTRIDYYAIDPSAGVHF